VVRNETGTLTSGEITGGKGLVVKKPVVRAQLKSFQRRRGEDVPKNCKEKKEDDDLTDRGESQHGQAILPGLDRAAGGRDKKGGEGQPFIFERSRPIFCQGRSSSLIQHRSSWADQEVNIQFSWGKGG